MLGCVQSNPYYEAVGIWLILAGIVGFIAMGVDKERAEDGKWRVPEMTLFTIALAGGALGMAIGSEAFRHKTSKLSFLLVLYAIVVGWLFLLYQSGFLDCLSTYIPR